MQVQVQAGPMRRGRLFYCGKVPPAVTVHEGGDRGIWDMEDSCGDNPRCGLGSGLETCMELLYDDLFLLPTVLPY